jgi:ribokinase
VTCLEYERQDVISRYICSSLASFVPRPSLARTTSPAAKPAIAAHRNTTTRDRKLTECVDTYIAPHRSPPSPSKLLHLVLHLQQHETATMSTPPILVLGSLNADLISTTPRLPRAGETLTATSFHTAPGGKGANQAVACARLSRPGSDNTRMVGAVGADAFAPMLLEALQASGVDTTGVERVEDVPTGNAIILVEETTGENRILIHTGANGTVTEKRGEKVFDGASAVVLQLEVPVSTVVWALRTARRKGVTTIFNPAPAVQMPEECWKDVDWVIVNESEAAVFTGVPEASLEGEGLEKAARWFLEKGCGACVVTLGAKGCYWMLAAGEKKGFGEVRGEGKVVDTTGAGDTFVGALAVAVVEGRPVEEVIEFASEASGRAVRKKGAQAGVPWRTELEPAK